ncbi:MAG: hypothetical protein R3325_15065 [Thermoanaerobaculia bacterium]|nr:hypothetical protein [Thermoanaerobaculia bacterium]
MLTLGVGLGGLLLVALLDFLRTPLVVFAVSVATLVGLFAALDRRVKLAISDAGVRYCEWGRAEIPWHEFSGYRWSRWRSQPHLQLVPRRPTELLATFSAVGRLHHYAGRLAGMPPFALRPSRLAISDAALDELLAAHLPLQPVDFEHPARG